MSKLRLLTFTLIALFAAAPRAFAQTGSPITDVAVDYRFGEQFTIAGRIDPAASYESIDIQIAFPGDPRILSVPVQPGPDGAFSFTHLIADRFVRAFSTVGYEFILTAPDGQVSSGGRYDFFYADNRFEWQALTAGTVTVHWYAGDAAYARSILDAAQAGLLRSQAILDRETVPALEVYAYAQLADYQFARGQFGQTWSGGHTDPSTGIVLAALPPGPEVRIEIERKVPHEAAHVSLFDATGAGFWNLPVWLNEGYASMLETTPNPDYGFLVSTALSNGTHIPLADLCTAFPRDASGALLAYAESASAVRYIEQTYGPAGLRRLVDAYAGGASCADGPLVGPIGLDLAGLEAAWRTAAPAAAGPTAPGSGLDLAALRPFLIVFAAVILGPGLVLLGAGLRRGRAGG